MAWLQKIQDFHFTQASPLAQVNVKSLNVSADTSRARQWLNVDSQSTSKVTSSTNSKNHGVMALPPSR